MKRSIAVAGGLCVAVGLIVLFGYLAGSGRIDVLSPAGDVAASQKQLLLFTLGLSALVVIPVFALLIYISIKYRSGNQHNAAYDPNWGENKWLEGLWWGIPIAIISVLAVVTFLTSHSLDPSKQLAGNNPITVQVVALQWKWLFLYPKEKLATLNYFALPVDRPIRFSLTANAPMSAFWIPSLGSQTYAMNGMASTLNLNATKVGEYTGYSTNINGEGYAKMTFKAKAMSPADYASWARQAKASDKDMTMQQYSELSFAKSETDERTYRLADKYLFDAIVTASGGATMQHGSAL